MKCLILLLLAVFVMANSPPRYPGFKIKITNKFLDAIKDSVKKISEKRAENMPSKIPAGVLPEGVKISSVKVLEHEVNNMDFTFAAPNLLRLTASDCKLVLEATVKKGDAEGKATVTVEGVNANMSIAFGRSFDTHLTLSMNDCQMAVGDVSIDVEGLGDDPAIAQFTAQAENMVKTILLTTCTNMEMGLHMATAYIGTKPTSLEMKGIGLAVDMGLMRTPTAADSGIEFEVSACTHLAGEAPGRCASSPITDNEDNSRMFYMMSTQDTSNTFFQKFHEAGLLGFKLDKHSDAVKYNTAKGAIKKLTADLGYTNFNDDDDIEASMTSLEAPTVEFSSGSETSTPIPKLHVKLQLKTKIRPGASDEKIIKSDVIITAEMHAKFNDTKEGEMVPKLDYHVKITELSLENDEGLELDAEQMAIATENMKMGVEIFLNAQFKQFQDYDNKFMKRFGRMGKLTNTFMKIADRTFVMGFDVEIDVDNMFAHVEKITKKSSDQ